MSSSSSALGLRLLAAIAICLGSAWTAQAAPVTSAMATGGVTSQPIGHYDFCKTNRAECAIRPADQTPVRMTGALWAQLARVNAAVNAVVQPMNDIDIYGKDEVWTYPAQGVGDCEDYVLEKRRRLHRLGVSLSNLLITVVRKPDGEGHAVLTVRTSNGDFILDNLTDKVRPWDETGYRFLKRQATDHTGRWVSIRDDQTVLVGSVQ